MIKFLITLALIAYVFYKIGGFFFRAGAAFQNRNYPPPRDPQANVNAKASAKKEKRNGTIKGGDYIDYEEVK
jgi:predicted porin